MISGSSLLLACTHCGPLGGPWHTDRVSCLMNQFLCDMDTEMADGITLSSGLGKYIFMIFLHKKGKLFFILLDEEKIRYN